MKTQTGTMSKKSRNEYIEVSRERYKRRNRGGKSAMINEVSELFEWDRKHTIKVLNGKVRLGEKARRSGSKATYTEESKKVIVEIWRRSEQPCGKRLKPTIPIWLPSYEARYGKIGDRIRGEIIKCSARQLDRITREHKVGWSGRKGRSTGRTSHRLKKVIEVRCGPWEVNGPGWLESDTVSHGGGSSSGQFMWSLTLTDIYSGWTELAGLWGSSGNEVCVGLRRIEKRMPFEMLGFDCDNGSEFLNSVLERYLRGKGREIEWTRSRAYKKNDQAHVEQKNFTHVRQLLGYERYDDIRLYELVNELYEKAWLPLRNYFTPVMKLIKKERIGSKVRKKYDEAKTPCQRLLDCEIVSEETKKYLEAQRSSMDPIALGELVEKKLGEIQVIVEENKEWSEESEDWEELEGEEESQAL